MKTLGIIFFTIFIDLLGFGIIIPILPVLVAGDLALPKYWVGLVAAIAPFMTFLFAPYWGSLSDSKGRRPVILISIVISMVGYLMFSMVNSLLLLLLSRLLAGIGSGNFSAAQAYIADISDPSKRAKNMGLIGAAFGLGFIFGPPLGGFLKSHYGLASVGWFTAGICLLNFVFVYFFLPESLHHVKSGEHSFKAMFANIGSALKNKTVRKLFAINGLFTVAFSMMQIASPLLWKERFHFDEKQIGYVFGYIGLCSVLVQAGLIGWLVRRLGEKRMLIAGSMLMLAGLTVLPFVPPDWFVPAELLALFCIALASGCIMPATGSLVSREIAPDMQGTIMGALQSLGSLARTAGPLFSGFLYMLMYAAPYLCGSLIMLLCIALAVFVRRTA